MSSYTYDFHIHSCLSPCGDDEMTPNSIAGMASLCNIKIAALTDHNTSKNCPAFFKACDRYGVVPLAGMELTTAEDIHVVCLFPTLEQAMSFDSEICRRRILIRNKTAVFGNQYIMDEDDNIIGSDDFLLPNATTITLEEAPLLAQSLGGVCYPAHVDREANGIIAVLGTFPDISEFKCAELANAENREKYLNDYPELKKRRLLVSSDAHYLWHIRDAEATLELDASGSNQEIRDALFALLRG